jgi:hypothetical protein
VHPIVHSKSSDSNAMLDRLVKCISSIDGRPFFSTLIGSNQQEQKVDVSLFQYALVGLLKSEFEQFDWVQEFTPDPARRDKIDIYGKSVDSAIVIELDKARADQVSKKFVSRVALFPDCDLYYIALCYPGTKRMNLNECLKYFEYCNLLARRMLISFAGLAMRNET